jgi:hypothetical protein
MKQVSQLLPRSHPIISKPNLDFTKNNNTKSDIPSLCTTSKPNIVANPKSSATDQNPNTFNGKNSVYNPIINEQIFHTTPQQTIEDEFASASSSDMSTIHHNQGETLTFIIQILYPNTLNLEHQFESPFLK